MNRLSTLLVLAIGLLLAGCFGSERPMFPLATAAPALGDGGRYSTYEIVDGKDIPSDKYDVRRRADGAYDFVDEKGLATPVSFHALPDGSYVAQVQLESKKGYGYTVFRLNGTEALIVTPECEKQDKAKMTAQGVEIRSKYECFIDKVADATAFFAGLTYGKPISKMVKN
jgi:hypothetical protein